MDRIKLLEEDVINKIAAGEVVENPASVVKELLENSIDAGADEIVVEIEDGGTTLIRVKDNGQGIDMSDVRLSFERHATSKISSEDDLFSIGSLGFRGEALSSIAAVSKVMMITRTEYNLEGTRVEVFGGIVGEVESCGAP
ncbi:MAG: ATP-binding protein, partial [Nanoarchaeota archaeon]|nr:ATP-binding protein [Nanoarchaeota archaeon]